MTQIPPDAQRSEDGQWWWDGDQWQAVADSAGSDPAPAPAVPQQIVLVGESGFTPVFPKVNEGVTYYWSEQNIGGAAPEAYHARVLWKKGDRTIDDKSVECSALGAQQAANRTTELSAPTESGIDYSIELWVDIDHNATASEYINYAYHTVTVDN